MRRLAAALLILLLPALAAAQGAEESIAKAITAYENLEVERALNLFQQVVSPTSPFPVTEAQRVIAYKYMGAALATLGKADSAITFFQAAITRDPFVDLDPTKFIDKERAAFEAARKSVFRVAVRVERDSIVAGSNKLIVFHAVTTHTGQLKVSLVRTDGVDVAGQPPIIPLFTAEDVDGVRDVPWNAQFAGSSIAPGFYDLVVAGQSTLDRSNASKFRPDSTRIPIEVRWIHEPLEDSLRALRADELLPTVAPASVAWTDLAKGFAVAAAAYGFSTSLGNVSAVNGTAGSAVIAAGAGAVVGLASFISRTNNRAIPENVTENGRRQAAWRAENDRRVANNQARLDAKTFLLIPTLGTGR
jgi:tetratricopeptide (TPR) repeat protein